MSGAVDVREGRAWVVPTGIYEAILDAAVRFSDCELLQAWATTPTAKYIRYFDLSALPRDSQESFEQAITVAIPMWEDDEAVSDFLVDSMKTFLRLLQGDSPAHPCASYERIDVREGESWIPPRRELDGIMTAVLRYADCPEIQHHLFKYWPRSRHLELQDFSSDARRAVRSAVIQGIAVWEKDDQFDDAFVESMKAFMEMLDGNVPQHEHAMYTQDR